MLDCRRVDALRLRFPLRDRPDLVLSQGVHAIGRDSEGRPCLVDDAAAAVAQICIDRRGVWLQLRDAARSLHVNGRPVRRMAMLRVGDAIYLDGVELLLLGARPLPAPSEKKRDTRLNDRRMVLRGVGGLHHGRCFGLEEPRLVGRAPDCDIRIDINHSSLADHHARLEPHAKGVVLRDLGSRDGSIVNGEPVRDALLLPGDQVVFATNQRFVVEAPLQESDGHLMPPLSSDDHVPMDQGVPTPQPSSSARRVPWLLLAAALLAGALSLLLMYGTR